MRLEPFIPARIALQVASSNAAAGVEEHTDRIQEHTERLARGSGVESGTVRR